jgi:mycothiol synthase
VSAVAVSLPHGWRPMTVDDGPAVAALIDEDEVFSGFRSRLGPEDVAEWTSRTNLESDSWLIERDSLLLAAGGGQLHAGTYFARGCVRPVVKGTGLGSVLVDLAEARATQHGVPSIHQVTLGPDHAARHLLESRGYREARRHYAMTIELGETPLPPQLPNDLAFEQFREVAAAAWYAASNEIFEDEWGFDLGTFDEWWRSRADDDHSLWFLVRDGAEIAGLVQAESGRRGGGLVNWVGVRRPWRRRGVGRALLLQAFCELRARGATRVGLGVDAENPSQATRFYESVGMHVEADHATFVRAF